MNSPYPISTTRTSELATNKVLRNTYLLLALTLMASAATAGAAIAFDWPAPGLIITLVGYFGLLFLTYKLRNSAGGLLAVFGLTSFMGYTLGPLVAHYLKLPNGSETVMLAFAGTATIFLGLSAYTLISRKDFSFMGGFLFIGALVAFLAGLGAIAFELPMLSLAVSAMFVLVASGLIMYQTSAIIHGGEDNYILATVSLYVSIYNLFVSLLQLLGFANSDD